MAAATADVNRSPNGRPDRRGAGGLRAAGRTGHNAGGFWATRRVTADGLRHTLAVNHLTPFLLTGRLEATAPARIVTVSCGAHATGKFDVGDLHLDLPGLLPS